MKKILGILSVLTLLSVLVACGPSLATVDSFELLNRRENHQVIASVDGDHWHGTLPAVDEGHSLSLGATLVVDGETLTLDPSGLEHTLSVRLAPGAPEGIVSLSQYGDHVHINGVQEGTTQVVFVWSTAGEEQFVTPPITVEVHEGHDHNHTGEGLGEIEVFEILNRGDAGTRVAYMHDDHWHGTLPAIPVGDRLSLGANITSVDGRIRELDAEGEVNGFEVRLSPGAPEGIVELVLHGDHVHVRGLQEGSTFIQFIWTHRGEIRYISPQIAVTVGDDPMNTTTGFGDIEVFELLNRGDEFKRVAYVHDDHWDGSLPSVPVGDRLSLGANITSVGERVRELDAEGEVNGFEVRLSPGATEGIVELVNHGDHVHVRGLQEGSTFIQFIWTHRGEVRYISPQISVTVVTP